MRKFAAGRAEHTKAGSIVRGRQRRCRFAQTHNPALARIQMEHNKDEMQERIIRTASALFSEQGIRAVRMDDVAHRLKMSKRTLYQYFSDKEELLLVCHKRQLKERDLRIAEQARHTDDVMELILWNIEVILKHFRNISPLFFKEISRYPKLVKQIAEENRATEQKAVDFLNKGVEQGLLLKSVNYRIFYRTTFQRHIEELLEEYTPYEIFMSSSYPSLRGCCTEKGRAKLDAFIEKHMAEEPF